VRVEQRGDVVARNAGLGSDFGLRVAISGVDLAAGGLSFVVVVLLGANGGGYWPVSWAWTAFLLAWVSLLLLLAVTVSLTRSEYVLMGASLGLVAWVALAATWSESVPRTVLEVQRVAAYAAIVVTFVLAARARAYGALLVGAWAAVVAVCTYSLLTRMFPDRWGQFDPFAGYRLSAPMGYWNALGIFAVLGIVLALGLAARARIVTSVVAAASLLVLVPTLYFTFSRASWLALGAGLAVVLAIDPRRLQFALVGLVLAIFPAIAVSSAYGSDALTEPATSFEAAVHDGHRLSVLIGVLAVAQMGVALALRAASQRIHVSERARTLTTVAAVAALVVALLAVVVRLGGPQEVVTRAYDQFLQPAPPSGLNQRLFSLSSNGRADLWSVAWSGFEDHRLFGSGPGTYEITWMHERPSVLKVRDAHSLYAESLAELGLAGTALIVLVLLLPLPASIRGRRQSFVPAAAGAYAAFLVHAGIDWDWEMTAVTGTGLICGIGILASVRPVELPPARRVVVGVIAGAMLLVALFSFTGVVGQRALASAENAVAAGNVSRADRDARRAERWLPWSSSALRVAGEAQLGLGRRARARSLLQRAIAKDPLDWFLWFELAIASDGQAQVKSARRAASLNPLSSQTRALLRELGLEKA
jgi:hypothetical protein